MFDKKDFVDEKGRMILQQFTSRQLMNEVKYRSLQAESVREARNHPIRAQIHLLMDQVRALKAKLEE